VLAPLGLATWMGVRMVREVTAGEQLRIDDQLASAHRAELEVIEQSVMRVLGDFERGFGELADTAIGQTPDDLREMVRKDSRVRQVFVLDERRMFVHPPESEEMRTDSERSFFDRISPVWSAGEPMFLEKAETDDSLKSSISQGWYSWFWGDGVQHVFWKQQPNGAVVGVEADRMALLAEVIGNLPEATDANGGLRVLGDERGRTIYQWGDARLVERGASPSAELVLGDPMSMWRLLYFAESGSASVSSALGKKATTGLISAVALAAALVLVLAWYFYREHGRQLRDADQRVSFVNQVSHELKTPLTNIRMYTELAADRVEAMDENDGSGARKFLGIVTDESERLSRLIANVLAFAKDQRGEVGVQLREGVVDDVVESVLEVFRPALAKLEIAVHFTGDAGDKVRVDPDALGQILANLISNVEKYAAQGKTLRIITKREGELTEICVEDDGAGIPKSQRERVFQAFARLSNQVSDGVTGTGIGLGIARRLARLHGGDLVLCDPKNGNGCCFILTLKTPN
jgi:signal transduction histidine kinase